MLKLKGQTETGEWVGFEASSICRADKTYMIVWTEYDPYYALLLTETIQPAEDPRKQMLDEIREQIEGFRYWTNYEGAVDFLISRTQVEMILDEQEAKR